MRFLSGLVIERKDNTHLRVGRLRGFVYIEQYIFVDNESNEIVGFSSLSAHVYGHDCRGDENI